MHEHGYRVVLTGEGSDETLAGYPHFRRDLLLNESGDPTSASVTSRLATLEQGNSVSRGLLLQCEKHDLS